jgi:hypothetical protein
VLLWRRKDQERRYEFKAYRGATGYNAACGKKNDDVDAGKCRKIR